VCRTEPQQAKVAVLPESRPKTQHHPWEVIVPVGAGSPGLQGVFQPHVEPLYQPVQLLMVSSCERVVDVEQVAQGAHRANVNWAPMVAGTLYLEIQLVNRALAQLAAVMEESGIASGH
jgi:hypothetical protein